MVFKPIYILILGFTIVIDYYAGILIENSEGPLRKRYLLMSLIANISVLAVFKYYNFINFNISELLAEFGTKNPIPYLNILLPIGLSFHTFQAMSYTIEVYRGNHKAERHFGIYSLYVMFFPQLVAGPIERPQNILYQFHERKYFNYSFVASGLKLMLWGFFKKLVVADRCAIYVNAVYGQPEHYNAATLITATLFFTVQIYCDFSGYTDIAIGCAKVMGFDLMKNFNRPYFARSVHEFWSRWHISLSTWFRDYLYIPLGGNRVKKPRWIFNLLIVFILSGLWHGANWTYIIWGGLNGLYLILAILILGKIDYKKHSALFNGINILWTFSLISFTWIFFRANSVHDAFLICESIFSFKKGGYFIGTPTTFMSSITFILFLFTVEFFNEYYPGKIVLFNNKNTVVRYLSYITIIFIIILFGVFDGGQFIYFQF